MKTVYINKFNILDYFDNFEERFPIQVSDEEYQKVQIMPYNKLWKWNEQLNSFVFLKWYWWKTASGIILLVKFNSSIVTFIISFSAISQVF